MSMTPGKAIKRLGKDFFVESGVKIKQYKSDW